MSLDSRLSLSEAARLVPGRPSSSALWRWCRRGVRARSGLRIRLCHVRIGHKVFTTRADLETFFAALTAADLAHFDAAPPPDSPPVLRPKLSPASILESAPRRGNVRRADERAIERASRELDAAGI